MSTKKSEAASNRRFARLTIFCLLFLLFNSADSSVLADNSQQESQQSSPPGHHLVVLLDINPDQKTVLAVEVALAEGIIQKLDQPANAFTIITFGSQAPVVLKSRVPAETALAAIREVTTERSPKKCFSVHFYDALNLGFDQFTDAYRKSLLVISEGNDYFPRKTFNQSVSRTRQDQIICDAAMVADHSFYGTKGVQRYGFDLRRLIGKTHGQYVEVGSKQKKVPRVVDRLSTSILNQR